MVRTGEETISVSVTEMDPYGADIYTEVDGDPDTLANLGPLRPMAGGWQGIRGADEHPVDVGTEDSAFIEHYELTPSTSKRMALKFSTGCGITPTFARWVCQQCFMTRSVIGSGSRSRTR